MRKILGISGVLLVVFVLTAVLEPNFLSAYNLQNTLRWTGLFGIISIGAGFVIISGGIDLSAGSVVGLVGVMVPMLLVGQGWPVLLALAAAFGVALLGGACARYPGYQDQPPAVCRYALRAVGLPWLGPLDYRRPDTGFWDGLRRAPAAGNREDTNHILVRFAYSFCDTPGPGASQRPACSTTQFGVGT